MAFNPNNRVYTEMQQAEEMHWWYKGLRCELMRWIEKTNPTSILDAGCGTGINLEMLQKNGYEAKGIDVSDVALDLARKRGVHNLQEGSITELPYQDNAFDLIYSFDVIGCLTEEGAGKALDEFYRCLHTGGRVVLNLAALESLRSKHDQLWDLKHRYTLQELKELLTQHGFDIEWASYRVGLLFPVVALVKLYEKLHQVSADSKSDVEINDPLLNRVLTGVMYLEHLLLSVTTLPIGSSVFVVAKKN